MGGCEERWVVGVHHFHGFVYYYAGFEKFCWCWPQYICAEWIECTIGFSVNISPNHKHGLRSIVRSSEANCKLVDSQAYALHFDHNVPRIHVEL